MARLQNGMSGLEGNGMDMEKTGLQDWAFEDRGKKGKNGRGEEGKNNSQTMLLRGEYSRGRNCSVCNLILIDLHLDSQTS